MKKPGFLAASLGTACLFAFDAAAVAHYALTPGGAEVIEVANAAEVRPAEAPAARPAAAPSVASVEGGERSASRATGAAANADKSSSVSRVSANALRGKSIAALNARDDDDDDDDDDD